MTRTTTTIIALASAALVGMVLRQPVMQDTPAGLFALGLVAGVALGASAVVTLAQLRAHWQPPT